MVSSVSIVKTYGQFNSHELCHVDGAGAGDPEAANASLRIQACIEADGRAPWSWLELTPLSRDPKWRLAIANHSTEITTSPTLDPHRARRKVQRVRYEARTTKILP